MPEEDRHVETAEVGKPGNVSNRLSQNISYGPIGRETVGGDMGMCEIPIPRYGAEIYNKSTLACS